MLRQNTIASIVGAIWGVVYAIVRAITVWIRSNDPYAYGDKPKAIAELPALEQTAIMLAIVLAAICVAILLESDRLTHWTIDDEIKENPSNPAIPAYLFLCGLARPFWLTQLVVEVMRFYKGQANAISAGIWIGLAVLSLAFLSLERRRARIRIRHWRFSVYVVPEQEEDGVSLDLSEQNTTSLEPVGK